MKNDKRHPWDDVEVEHHDDEGWIVSYADMVTLLFGFFVILYSFSTVDEKKYDKMTEELASAFKSQEVGKSSSGADNSTITEEGKKIRALHMLLAMMNIGDANEETIQKIEAAYNTDADSKDSTIVSKDIAAQVSGMKLSASSHPTKEALIDLVLPAQSLFQPGQSDVLPDAVQYLKRVASDLRSTKNIESIEITGHTDASMPSAHSAYKTNFVLSSLRAGMIAETLIRFGVNPKLIVVRGVGSLEPLAPDYGADGKAIPENMAKNRRVHIVVKRKMP